MSLIPQYKIGDCSVEDCGLTETEGRKVGKKFFCANHYSDMKKKEQITKANIRQSIRGLIKYERQEGVLDSVQELILDLDRVVSRYLRIREMDAEHKCRCYTCGSKKDWNKVHAGHFISRSNLGLRWDLTYNIRIQCPNCNINLRGNIPEYKKKLEAENNGITDYLYEQSKEVFSPARDELKMLLHEYQMKLNTVEKKLTQNVPRNTVSP